MSHGGLKRARSWKRRIQPKEAYSSPGLLYSEEPVSSRARSNLPGPLEISVDTQSPEEEAGLAQLVGAMKKG